MYIKLHVRSSGKPVYISVRHIVMVLETPDEICYVETVHSGFEVEQSVQEVMQFISGASRVPSAALTRP